MSSSGFAPRRRQGGFIQGAILFALVIIAVVVAAFSLANRDSQNNADNEQARVNGAFVLKVGNDIQTGVNRAIADGFATSDIADKLLLIDGADPAVGELDLFDATLRYVARPQFPPTALIPDAEQPFGDNETGAGASVTFESVPIDGVGGAADDVLLYIPDLRNDVCRRINVTANNVLPTAAPPTAAGENGAREGCFAATAEGTGTYFRVVATDVG